MRQAQEGLRGVAKGKRIAAAKVRSRQLPGQLGQACAGGFEAVLWGSNSDVSLH